MLTKKPTGNEESEPSKKNWASDPSWPYAYSPKTMFLVLAGIFAALIIAGAWKSNTKAAEVEKLNQETCEIVINTLGTSEYRQKATTRLLLTDKEDPLYATLLAVIVAQEQERQDTADDFVALCAEKEKDADA